MATMNSLPGSGANSMRGSGSPVRRNEPFMHYHIVAQLPDGTHTVCSGTSWSNAMMRAMEKVGSDYLEVTRFTDRDLPGGERYE